MATHRLDITPCLFSQTAAVYWDNSANHDTNDRYPHEVLVFTDTATDDSVAGVFAVPNNYSAATTNPTVEVIWRTPATSGNVRWALTTYVATGDNTTSMDPSTDTEAPAAWTDTAGAAAMRRMVTSVTLTRANYSAGATVLVKLTRTGTNAGDTLANKAIVESVVFQYADA